MKTAIMVTSVIDIDNTHPLTYSKVRSYFSDEERLRHTIFTIASLDHVCDDETTIFLLDASVNAEKYESFFKYQKNLVYVNVAKEFPEVFDKIRTHPHKSHCEMMLQISFLNKYQHDLKKFDFIFKASGRYFFDSSFNLKSCTPENNNKLLFKHPLEFEWNDRWGYSMVDRRAAQSNNKLRQYSSVLYGWSNLKYDRMLEIFRVIADFTDTPNYMHYDVETLLYFFTRDFEQDIVEHDWKIYGWTGVNGNFLRY